MAITETSGVRASGGGNSGTASATYAGATTSGRLLICNYTARSQSSVHPATPSGWSIGRQNNNGGGNIIGQFYKIANGSETSVSLTLNASANWVVHLHEFNSSNGWAAVPLDKSSSNNSISGTAGTTGLTGTLGQANELVVTAFCSQAADTWSAHDNGQTELQETTQGASSIATLSTAWKEVSATTSVNYGATLSASGGWQALVATYKIQTAGAIAMSTSFSLAMGSSTLKGTAVAAMSATLTLTAAVASFVQGAMTAAMSLTASGTLIVVTYLQGAMKALFGMQFSAPPQAKVNAAMTAPVSINALIRRAGNIDMTAGLQLTGRFYPELHYGAKFRQKLGDVYSTREALARAIAAKLNALAEASANVLNGSFENGLVSWSLAESGWSYQTSSFAVHGTKVAVKSGGWADSTLRNDGRLACSQNKRVTCTASVRSSGANGNIGTEIHWFTQSGTYISKDSAITTTAASCSGSWIQTRCIAVAPANAAYGCAAVRVTGHTQGTYYADQVTMEIQPQNQTDMPPINSGNVGGSWVGLSITSAYDAATPAGVTIDVSAATLQMGDTAVNYNASSAVVSQTRGTTVTYQLYYIDPLYTGGSKTLNATTTGQDVVSGNGNVWVGYVAVTVPASGSGSGGSGGGGGGCPMEDSLLPDGRRAGDIVVGDELDLCNPFTHVPGRGTVTFSQRKLQPCVRVRTSRGSFSCSESAPIPTLRHEYVAAGNLKGEVILSKLDGIKGYDSVLDVESLGLQWVQHITVGDQCFWISDDGQFFVLHHNAKPTD